MTTATAQPVLSTLVQLFARATALAITLACLWYAWNYPVAAMPLTIGLAAYAMVLLVLPSAWMIVLPATLPVLELGYWSGRLFFTEFDLLVLVTLASGLWHGGHWSGQIDRATRRVALVLLFSQAALTLHGLLPLYAPAPGAWDDYFASTNALREFRGLLWALMLWPMLAAARARGDDIQRLFAVGMIASLVAAVASIVWERGLFTGLFDFTDPYRISGWFISMQTGGAAIDAFLAMTVPFALAPLFLWRHPAIRATSLIWLGGGLYAFYVTYSRANYPALVAMLAVLVLGLSLAATRGRRSTDRRPSLLPVIASAAFAGAMLLLTAISLGPNIESRFATSSSDMQTRIQHWTDVVELAKQDPAAVWIGRGKGRFAHDYYWEHTSRGEHLALAQLHADGDSGFVRFSPSDHGGSLYLRQRFQRTASDQYRLELTLRTPRGQPEALLIEFCERHMLKFLAECRWRKVNLPASNGEWRDYAVDVNLAGLGHPRFGPFSRPLEVALMNRGIDGGMDIGAVQLYAADGSALLGNPDFSAGWDHWFASYGDHLRWHIKSVFLHWFYEGGVAMLAIMAGIGLFSVVRLGSAAAAGDAFSLLGLAALVGTIAVGLFDSLFDDARVSLLFFTLLGAGLISRPLRPALIQGGLVLPSRSLGRLARGGGLLAVIALLVYLVMPSLYRPLEVRLSMWAEGRGSFFARLLVRDYAAPTAANLAAAVDAWRPGAETGLRPGEIRAGGRSFTSLQTAAGELQDGDTLEIGAGIYREPLVIRANGVRVVGSGHVVIERTQAEGKAAIITKGNGITIENIECREIRVGDGNGACVRHEGRDLVLRHVWFHDAEVGLLTGQAPGHVHIVDSRFSQLGSRGRVHGIGVGGGELLIEDSQVLAARGWSHAVQSFATSTRIVRSRIASLGSNDSRLLDLPRGGVLEIVGSVLQHGPASANDDAIGFGHAENPHPEQRVELIDSTVILERDGGNRLFEFGQHPPAMALSGNLLVNSETFDMGTGNRHAEDREQAGLAAFPLLPR